MWGNGELWSLSDKAVFLRNVLPDNVNQTRLCQSITHTNYLVWKIWYAYDIVKCLRAEPCFCRALCARALTKQTGIFASILLHFLPQYSHRRIARLLKLRLSYLPSNFAVHLTYRVPKDSQRLPRNARNSQKTRDRLPRRVDKRHQSVGSFGEKSDLSRAEKGARGG